MGAHRSMQLQYSDWITLAASPRSLMSDFVLKVLKGTTKSPTLQEIE